MKNQYVTDSKLKVSQDRVEDKAYKTQQGFLAKFKVAKTPKDVSLCGNVRVSFLNSVARLHSGYTENEKSTASYEQISSALALYRAVSMFKTGTNPKEQDFYKMNWSVTLKHKATGKYLMLGEWKGGFQIFTEGYSADSLPKEFIKDTEHFMSFFVSTEFPIGYDGVVAGCVA